jgi:hypothetical protein
MKLLLPDYRWKVKNDEYSKSTSAFAAEIGSNFSKADPQNPFIRGC